MADGGAFVDGTMAIIDSIIGVSGKLGGAIEDTFSLSAGQTDAALLAIMFSVALLLFLAVNASTIVKIPCFLLIVCVGSAIECRTAFADHVVDRGFEATVALHDWFTAPENQAINEGIAAANSIMVLLGMFYALGRGLTTNDWSLNVKGALAICCRMVIGSITRLPVPAGFVPVKGDWPPSSADCTGFVFNPSGHVLGLFLATIELRRTGWHTAALLADIVNLAQAVRLVALRGHYSVDIITAYLVGYMVNHVVEGRLSRPEPKKKKEAKAKAN